MCGGTTTIRKQEALVIGLSPRVRGNRAAADGSDHHYRSIPACAGEPVSCLLTLWRRGVYPRVCGGTISDLTTLIARPGLSPRVRGNRVQGVVHAHGFGSIPACAGEPGESHRRRRRCRVYPRVCGGTCGRPLCAPSVEGLSPRVRGNPVIPEIEIDVQGSIPACAGEPLRCYPNATLLQVYPRVCGGTQPAIDAVAGVHGLSPRVRGNRRRRRQWRQCPGSIPACAGEPSRGHCSGTRRGVYPRVCGGTRVQHHCPLYHIGLSPRVRGNLRAEQDRLHEEGSIPACAGEPHQ